MLASSSTVRLGFGLRIASAAVVAATVVVVVAVRAPPARDAVLPPANSLRCSCCSLLFDHNAEGSTSSVEFTPSPSIRIGSARDEKDITARKTSELFE